VDNSLLETAYRWAPIAATLCGCCSASFRHLHSSVSCTTSDGPTYSGRMVNARRGVGYMVEAARKMMDFERVYAGIIAIGVPHSCSAGAHSAGRLAVPWARPSSPASASVAAIGGRQEAKVAHDK